MYVTLKLYLYLNIVLYGCLNNKFTINPNRFLSLLSDAAKPCKEYFCACI